MWGEVTHTVAGSWCCLFSAGRGSRGLTESSQKVQSWSTNSSRLPCRSCGLVQLGCCVWGLGASSRQKSAPFKTSLGGRADDLARCVTHHTPCWQASQFQLHGCSSHRCSVCVCVCVCVCEGSLLLLLINTVRLYESYPGQAQSKKGVALTLMWTEMLLSDSTKLIRSYTLMTLY